MKGPRKLWSLAALLIAFACENAKAQSSASPTASGYGAFPTDYKQIISAWLNEHLDDPKSSVVKWKSEPRPAELAGPDGRKIAGFLVDITVNARNRFGVYTGAQKHGMLIRDGAVVKATGFVYR